jgi:hypothetical protein
VSGSLVGTAGAGGIVDVDTVLSISVNGTPAPLSAIDAITIETMNTWGFVPAGGSSGPAVISSDIDLNDFVFDTVGYGAIAIYPYPRGGPGPPILPPAGEEVAYLGFAGAFGQLALDAPAVQANWSFGVVPEPSAIALGLFGATAFLFCRARNRRFVKAIRALVK